MIISVYYCWLYLETNFWAEKSGSVKSSNDNIFEVLLTKLLTYKTNHLMFHFINVNSTKLTIWKTNMDYIMKICAAGSTTVGKTSILQSFIMEHK